MNKCELSDDITKKTIKIKNKKNGNELEICRRCAVKFGFIKTPQKGATHEANSNISGRNAMYVPNYIYNCEVSIMGRQCRIHRI